MTSRLANETNFRMTETPDDRDGSNHAGEGPTKCRRVNLRTRSFSLRRGLQQVPRLDIQVRIHQRRRHILGKNVEAEDAGMLQVTQHLMPPGEDFGGSCSPE